MSAVGSELPSRRVDGRGRRFALPVRRAAVAAALQERAEP